ncbi:hypothetical protein [cf. Phormidesmis sp. LEGE 11477]|uniref:hypothetical protein n=1 Tax=cf. Phormidesmis sp. LEGE 11477 TaxID=1828680 RepID=UPI0018805823|nr:hypothetical protein [cf. Phormidesmis sp. LEGE 11477]MBE9060256.1 hypothetical protein [cf. Phormidesmis sp. LEGE 11477]
MTVDRKQAIGRLNTVLRASFLQGSWQRRSSVVLLALFGVSTTLPVLAQTKPITSTVLSDAYSDTYSDKAQGSNDQSFSYSGFDLSIDQFIAAETSHFSLEEKQALHALIQLDLEESTLSTLSNLADAELKTQLKAQFKNNPKFNKLPAEIASAKFSPAVFAAARLAGYMRSIGKAVLLGNVVGAIRAAEFDFPAMFSALSTGDTTEFASLLSAALPRQTTFVSAVSTGATFACNTATLDLTPGVCDRFSSFMRSTLVRYQRSAS